MYILIEEYNDWMDYITTTQYKILMCSEDEEKLKKYRNDNCESMSGEESEIFYYIQKTPIL